MNKLRRAHNLLIELESLKEPNPSVSNILALLNEALRDAELLAKEVIAEESADQKVAA